MPDKLSEKMSGRNLLDIYRESVITAAILTRINVWEHLEFGDLTDTVRGTMCKIEEALSEARTALVDAMAVDPGISQEMIMEVSQKKMVPRMIKQLQEKGKNHL